MADESLKAKEGRQQSQKHSRLPEDLQRLVDEEERYRFASGDFENSWTSTRIKEDSEKARTQPMGTDDREGQERAGNTKYKMP